MVKIDMHRRALAAQWAAPSIFFTEADFVARPGATEEDDGVLLSVLYNATSDLRCVTSTCGILLFALILLFAHLFFCLPDLSALAVFDAATLALLAQYPLGMAVPFHAHGIVCPSGSVGAHGCYTNP